LYAIITNQPAIAKYNTTNILFVVTAIILPKRIYPQSTTEMFTVSGRFGKLARWRFVAGKKQ
jgi:hypothetical protein